MKESPSPTVLVSVPVRLQLIGVPENLSQNIVWAPLDEIYWPAVVTQESQTHVDFHYIGHQPATKHRARKAAIMNFKNAQRNQDLRVNHITLA